VASNLARVRKERGLTQRETVERLAPFLAHRWSVASLSAAERSVDGKRVKQFDADELIALSSVFDVPLAYWFQPKDDEAVTVGDKELSHEELASVLFGAGDDGDHLLISLLSSSVANLASARRVLNLVVPILEQSGRASLSDAGDRTGNATSPMETSRHQSTEGDAE
jgi:transcriptional regulator with XRE-family HTH domain